MKGSIAKAMKAAIWSGIKYRLTAKGEGCYTENPPFVTEAERLEGRKWQLTAKAVGGTLRFRRNAWEKSKWNQKGRIKKLLTRKPDGGKIIKLSPFGRKYPERRTAGRITGDGH